MYLALSGLHGLRDLKLHVENCLIWRWKEMQNEGQLGSSCFRVLNDLSRSQGLRFPRSWNDDMNLLSLNPCNLSKSESSEGDCPISLGMFPNTAYDSPWQPIWIHLIHVETAQRSRVKWKGKDSNTCSAGTGSTGRWNRHDLRTNLVHCMKLYWGDVSTISSRMVNNRQYDSGFALWWCLPLVWCFASTGKEIGTTDGQHGGTQSFFAL